MSEETEFLEYIYINANLVQENVARIIKERNEEDSLTKTLKEQIKDYRKICNSAKNMLERRNRKVKDISLLSKIATYMSVKINIDTKDNISSMAKIMIQSSEIGILEIKKKIEEYNVKNKTVINIANRLISFEETNISRLKQFLD